MYSCDCSFCFLYWVFVCCLIGCYWFVLIAVVVTVADDWCVLALVFVLVFRFDFVFVFGCVGLLV